MGRYFLLTVGLLLLTVDSVWSFLLAVENRFGQSAPPGLPTGLLISQQ